VFFLIGLFASGGKLKSFFAVRLKTLSNFFMFFPQKTADLSKKSAAF